MSEAGASCAELAVARAAWPHAPVSLPVILVHGIWDSSDRLAPLAIGLVLRGVADVVAIDLRPNDGRAPISELAAQVKEAVAAATRRHGKVDLVGFSMGALTSRYYIQRLGGRDLVRRFVSISGPQRGTLTAYALPFIGAKQMRPKSPLLQDLASDADPWGPVEVHTVITPYDAMILPSSSGELVGSMSHTVFPVKLHRWMIEDPRVLDHVAKVLLA
jgi:triacylglycerol lipase